MSKKPILSTVVDANKMASLINANDQALADAFDNTISRDGSTPNQMEADLDLNSNDLLNVKDINAANLVVGGINLNTKVAEAETSATNAATSETNAATSETNAASSASAAAQSFDDFDDIYLGVKTSDPTLDNDGDALQEGATYFNSVTTEWKIFVASAWIIGVATGSGSLLKVNNLSDVGDTDTSLGNLGGGTTGIAAFKGETAAAVRTTIGAGTGDGSLNNIVEDTTPQLGGTLDTNSKSVFWSKGTDVASATELLVLTDGNSFDVTGTTTIATIEDTADAFGIGSVIMLQFDGILTLTHHVTNLVLLSGANIVTAAGDWATFIKSAAGDWRMISYTKASGEALVATLAALSKSYTSSGQTITAGGLLTLAHSFSEVPKLITAYLKCTTANLNYSIGDEVLVTLINNTGTNPRQNVVYFDTTNIYFRASSLTFAFVVSDKLSGANNGITNASWDLYVRAWA